MSELPDNGDDAAAEIRKVYGALGLQDRSWAYDAPEFPSTALDAPFEVVLSQNSLPARPPHRSR